jgi:hypothetical protein
LLYVRGEINLYSLFERLGDRGRVCQQYLASALRLFALRFLLQ